MHHPDDHHDGRALLRSPTESFPSLYQPSKIDQITEFNPCGLCWRCSACDELWYTLTHLEKSNCRLNFFAFDRIREKLILTDKHPESLGIGALAKKYNVSPVPWNISNKRE